MPPTIIRPFEDVDLLDIQNHVKEIRRAYEGTPYHDAGQPEHDRFNRWYWHNLPVLRKAHYSRQLIERASTIFGEKVKPSYVFLSMYGPDGVCPLHTDRPQCKYTVDMVIRQDAVWPIYISDHTYHLVEGGAVCYSGTDQPHYRKPMNLDSKATYCDLAFFHFVPEGFEGRLE